MGGYLIVFFGERGQSRNRQRSSSGESLKASISITLEESILGCKKEISYNTYQKCTGCEGSGSKSDTQVVKCTGCNGTGTVNSQQGFFIYQQTCVKCQGQGIDIQNPCGICSGQGRKTSNKKLEINVPAGISDQTNIKLNNEGSVGVRGGRAGDLYVEVRVKKHDIFTREGSNLACTIPTPYTVMALGGSIDIPWVDKNKIQLNIPAGTQSGEILRVSKKGAPSLRTGRQGDLHCKIVTQIPVKLSSEIKEQLKVLDNLLNKDSYHSTQTKKWYKYLKEFFS